MKSSIKLWLIPLLFILYMFSTCLSLAQTHFEVTPSISVSEVYDDNIYLTYANEESDYITTVSPSIDLNIISENSNLTFLYSPTFVRYAQEDENDTVRHSGTLTFSQELSQRLRFDLTDTYLRTEEPVETTEGIESVRSNRNTYQRNTGRATLQYTFGEENALSLGYGHSMLENEDITLDDGTTRNPFANMTYWFNVKNGIELDYQYTKADFTRDDNNAAGDDYTGNAAGIRYLYRFTPHTTGYAGYDFTNRHFEGLSEDYKVHEGTIGFDHSFSQELSLSVGGGYFIQKNRQSDDEKGYSYNTSLVKSLEQGSISFGGQGGWSEAYLEAERTGFTRYWGLNSQFEYQLMERLSSYAGGSYRRNKEPGDREWETLRANCGISWAFYQYFSLSLDYSSSTRDDDINTDDYNANRIMLILSAGKMYRW